MILLYTVAFFVMKKLISNILKYFDCSNLDTEVMLGVWDHSFELRDAMSAK